MVRLAQLLDQGYYHSGDASFQKYGGLEGSGCVILYGEMPSQRPQTNLKLGILVETPEGVVFRALNYLNGELSEVYHALEERVAPQEPNQLLLKASFWWALNPY